MWLSSTPLLLGVGNNTLQCFDSVEMAFVQHLRSQGSSSFLSNYACLRVSDLKRHLVKSLPTIWVFYILYKKYHSRYACHMIYIHFLWLELLIFYCVWEKSSDQPGSGFTTIRGVKIRCTFNFYSTSQLR